MSTARAQIIDAFEDPHHLLCEYGMFAEGNSTTGTWIIYWGNGRLRSLISFLDGFRNGLSINYHINGMISSFTYYRMGTKYGESGVLANDGRYLKHVINDVMDEREYEVELAKKYPGFTLTGKDLTLERKYRYLRSNFI